MKGVLDKPGLKIAVVCFGVPATGIAARFLLSATIGIPFIILIAAVLTIPAVKRRTDPALRWQLIHGLVFLAGGILLIGSIIITPFRSYEAWFASLVSGQNTGTSAVSNLFVSVSTYFAALLIPAVISAGIGWAFASLAIFLLFLAAVVTQQALLSVLFTVGIILMLIVRMVLQHGQTVPARHLVRYLLSVGALAFGLALLLSGLPTKASRSFVDSELSPALRQAVISFNPDFPLLYDMARASRDFTQKELGGYPSLSGQPIFDVYGTPGQTIYLRMSVLDDYDGTSWKISRQVLHGGLRFRSPSYTDRFNPPRMRIRILAGNIDLIPMTLDTIAFYARGVANDIVEGNYDTGFRIASPLPTDRTLTLLRVTQIMPILAPELRKAYLELPKELPPRLTELAHKVTQGATSQEDTLRRIQRYLAQNYTYTLTPARSNVSKDFVTSFLFGSSGGYCVQFASAFVILARINGIPARYATGYLANIPADKNNVTVTGLTSHAWPEVWLPSKGWSTWEATPAVDPASYHRAADGAWVYDYRIEDNSNTSRQLAGILGVTVQPGTDTAPVQPPETNTVGPPVLLFAAVGALLLLAAAFILLRRNPTGASEQEVRFYRSLRKTVGIATRKHGIPNPAEIGWLAWNEHTTTHLDGSSGPVSEVMQMAIRHLYAGQPLPAHAVHAVRRARKAIRKRRP